ncbi:hypothetical protein Sgleb_73670 [Streptomyces glebosus]|uniref:Transposase IS4-like domain-containing protein n=1 Tax=Streptomyces glebosus TaxID=249580 RepID=A0A640T806_9ACTN|nr:hypothetical protein Sgleb_73670 [Streptomyces glebosus]GHG62302.1 hypothetical protein GCM10010513_28890 [Streptomyces glebosus]
MVDRAVADNVPYCWLTGDEAYGQSKSWRHQLEEADIFHVMATRCNDTVVTHQRLDHRIIELIAGLPRQKWKRRSCGAGAYGQRIFDWARAEVRPWHRPDRRHRDLARRSLAAPHEIAYYIAYAPADATPDDLIAVAGTRWAIEECFQSAKGACGLDHHQVRRYQGWHRHITLAMAAHAFLTVTRATELATGKAETDPLDSSRSASPNSDA